MPTAYKGKIRITCGKEACPNDPARADVGSDCFICADSQSEILDLEDRTIGIRKQPDSDPEIDKQEKPAAKRLKLVKKED
jgi:hypothetical protein